jgi:hypothetical protein
MPQGPQQWKLQVSKPGHIKDATRANNMGGSQKGKPE